MRYKNSILRRFELLWDIGAGGEFVPKRFLTRSIPFVCLMSWLEDLKKEEMVNKENVLVVNKKKKVLECIEVDSRSPTDMIRDCIESHENHVTSFLRILSQFKI